MAFFQHPSCLVHFPCISLGSCTHLLMIFLFASCSSVTPTTSRATPTVSARPPHIQTPLALPPQDCAISHPPRQRHLATLGANSNVELVGDGPFWIYDGYYRDVLHLAPFGFQGWPMTKMIVEVGPNYTQPVTLRLRESRTKVLAWWTDGQTPPETSTQTLVLNPQTNTQEVAGEPDIPHGSPEPDWKEWGLFPLFPVAGCYRLEVNWAGGSWRSSFAVGN